ncbi:glutamine-rich protein 2 isoform X2 [Poecilia formosa]|uniref:glutamine-rich protein 2 isoform X2 n=1 Tax=Poecilia formosa TaxID=48698 RepID=UPI0007B8A25F|nr:PREDICTED: glutamine-rich protein 2-like isoform X2 [Poecilia formosa]
MEKNISLFELLNLSIGSPHKSSVNFSALHALLLEMLKLLDLREATTCFKFSPPGDRVLDAPLGAPVKVPTHPSVSDQLVPPGSDLQKLTDSVSVLDGTGGDDFRTSGDGVSQALNLIEELQKNRDDIKQKTEHLQSKASNIIEDLQRSSANLREKAEELQHKALKVIEQLQDSKDLKEKTDDMQHKGAAEQMEIQAGLEKCCQRLDVLDKAVESMQELFQMYPDPEELNQCVTWVQLVQKDMDIEKDLGTSEALDQPWLEEQTGPDPSAPSSGVPVPSTGVLVQYSSANEPSSTAPALSSGASVPASGVPVPSPGASAPSSGTTVLSPSASALPSGSSSPSSGVSVSLSGGPLHTDSSSPSAAPSFPSISAEDQSLEAAADSTQASSDGSEGGTITGDQGRATEPQPVTSSVLPGSTPETVPQPEPQPGAKPEPQPGPHPGTQPGPQPAAHPGPQPGPHPGTQPGPQPAAHPGPHPGPQAGPHPGEHPAAQPGPQPTRIRGDLKRLSDSPESRTHSMQMEEFLKNIRKLQERVTQLEAHTRILEEQKVDWTGLAQFISSRGSLEVPGSMMDQVQQHQALMENLKTEHEKLEHLEDMLGNLMTQEMGSSIADHLDSAIKDLTQQVSDLRSSLVQVEQEVELLKEKQAQSEERAADHLQDQLNDLRGTLEDTIVSLTSQLSSSLQQEVEQETEKMEKPEETEEEEEEEEEAFSNSVEVGRKLSLLFQNYEQLEDTVNLLVQQQQQGAARDDLDEDRDMGRSLDLVYDVQRAIQELQAECERLQEATRSLHEDNQQKQGHIEELYKTAEELQVKKADKLMVESEIKADKLALDSKVSRLQFDAATEQLTSMFHELLNKMTGQEHDWHQLVDKLSTDMECKLNRMELDSVKLQLEERWRSILKKLQAQSAPLEDDAAGIRKKLLERFHCLSCDRVIMKQTPGPIVLTLPTFPPFPPPKSARPWTMEQIRQHYHSLTPGPSQRRVQLQKNHADMLQQLDSIERQRRLRQRPNRVTEAPARQARPVGGPHASTSAGQRRSGPQHHRLTTRAEDEILMQEADIIGRDGRIYKGRFSVDQLKSPETKLPNIASRDGKLKERTRNTPKTPAVSPEAEPSPLATPPSLSTKSLQPSQPASSGSGPDWAVSPLGSISPPSAAESEPLGL